MAISKENRALKRLLGWLSEGDLELIVWRTEDDTPVMVSVVDMTASPPHTVTVRVMNTQESEDT
jgi:hypothetical protein